MDRATPITKLAFALTIFTGATLLFTVEPMVARMIAPLLGGAPQVWVVCSLCFQTLLLAGYAYVHLVGTRAPSRAQVGAQLVLLAAVGVGLPFTIEEGLVQRLTAGHPAAGVFVLLLRTIGLPFFVLATSSPLLQRWFAELGEADPYYLYAASNAGSMLALFGYPLVLEPRLAVREQSRAFQVGFAVYATLVVVCGLLVVRARGAPAGAAEPGAPSPPTVRPRASERPAEPSARARWRERLAWIGLSFGPSSLLLGATEYVSAEIASVPLLWVIPLALYLLSFIVGFAKLPGLGPRLATRALVAAVALVTGLTLVDAAGALAVPKAPLAIAHLALLFVASVVCHRQLAARRPEVERLTEFYLAMSVGGVLGGAFNGLFAPLAFDGLYEYPIAVGLVCLGGGLGPRVVRDAAVGLLVAGTAGLAARFGFAARLDARLLAVVLVAAPIALGVAWGRRRPLRFAIATVGLLLAGMGVGGRVGTVEWADRSFFGVLQVVRDARFRLLFSGRALEGQQALAPEEAALPLAYYHPTGPVGDVLGRLGARPRRVGVVGLGIGSLAAYARPGDAFHFFELSESVLDVAEKHFSYLGGARARGATISVETGDARLRLREGPPARFDVLVLDAFASDALPVHLVTREALAVYRRALAPGGVLLIDVSNEHLRLRPVFGALARDARMAGVGRRDDAPTAAELAAGKLPSEWLALAERRSELDLLIRASEGWRPLEVPVSQAVWTDDFADVLAVVRF